MQKIEEANCLAQSALGLETEDAIRDAMTKLRRVARGEAKFQSDHQLRACLALARMIRLLIVKVEPQERSLAHPSHSPAEVLRLMDLVEGKRTADQL
jgi:hypothetical protein